MKLANTTIPNQVCREKVTRTAASATLNYTAELPSFRLKDQLFAGTGKVYELSHSDLS